MKDNLCTRCGKPLPPALAVVQKFHASQSTCINNLRAEVVKLRNELDWYTKHGSFAGQR